MCIKRRPYTVREVLLEEQQFSRLRERRREQAMCTAFARRNTFSWENRQQQSD